MPNEFLSGPGWEGSSGPILSRQLTLNDIWPEGPNSYSGGVNDKDDLVDGMHMAFAVGVKANRPLNPVGVTISFAAQLVQMNFAPGFIFAAYVANILTYNAGHANTWDASLALGDPVYVDDSEDISTGCTLSRASQNDLAQTNPRAGYIWYGQSDYIDSYAGGLHTTSELPIDADPAATEEVLCWVMLWPDQF